MYNSASVLSGVNVQELFPGFRDAKVLRFSRLFPIKESHKPKIWKHLKKKKGKAVAASQQQQQHPKQEKKEGGEAATTKAEATDVQSASKAAEVTPEAMEIDLPATERKGLSGMVHFGH